MTYTREQIKLAAQRFRAILRTKGIESNDSMALSASKVFTEDSGLLDVFLQQLDTDSNPIDSGLHSGFSPGDRALFLQSGSADFFEFMKHVLSVFRSAEYGMSEVYSDAAAIEPDVFCPKVFPVAIIRGPSLKSPSIPIKGYICSPLEDDGTVNQQLQMFCSENMLFNSEDDVSSLKRIYSSNKSNSIQWLNAVLSAHSKVLSSLIENKIFDINHDDGNNVKAIRSYEDLFDDVE